MFILENKKKSTETSLPPHSGLPTDIVIIQHNLLDR